MSTTTTTTTAEPGSPTIFAPISFSAWNSAHHRPRKVTPKSFPIVNAARIYHFDNMTSIGMWFPHCERKSHHSKKHVFEGLNWGTVKCFSHCQRDVKSYPFASISGMIFFTCGMCFSHCQRDVTSYPVASISVMIFMYVECAFPIVNAHMRRDASYWQRDMKPYTAPLMITIPYARQCISASRISA